MFSLAILPPGQLGKAWLAVKTAYLIPAHNRPAHLLRLVRALDHESVDFFIHIDAKTDIRPFEPVKQLPNVFFVEPRIKVYWGGFSQVAAALRLLRTAHAHGHYKYFIHLSGNDYPIRSNAFIQDYLRTSTREHLNLVEMPNPELHRDLDRLTDMRLEWLSYFHHERFETRSFEALVSKALHKLNRTLKLRPLRRDFRKVFGELQPFAGGSWWGFTEPAVSHILNFVEEHRSVVQYFRHTKLPDEMFFQTIIGNSPLRSAVSRSLTFDDFSREEPPHPALIDRDHLARFLRDDCVIEDCWGRGVCLFARKFGDENDDILDEIDRHLRNETRSLTGKPRIRPAIFSAHRIAGGE